MPIRHLLLPEPGPRAGMVQTVPWLHRAVAVVLGAWVRKLVLRVRLTTTVQPPRSIRLRCTLDPAQETQIQPVGCPPPSTTTLASKIKCRSAAPPDTGRVWLLVGIEPASAPVQAAVPSRWRREPPRSGTSLTCRSRPTAEEYGRGCFGISCWGPAGSIGRGVPAVRLREINIAVSRDRPASGGQQLSTRCLADMFGLNEPIQLLGIASGGNC
jgi:hypothetical protein